MIHKCGAYIGFQKQGNDLREKNENHIYRAYFFMQNTSFSRNNDEIKP